MRPKRVYGIKTAEFEINFMLVTNDEDKFSHYRVIRNGEVVRNIPTHHEAKKQFWKYVENMRECSS